jgi:hypothetical protein
MGIHSIEKKHLSANGMLRKIRAAFDTIPEHHKDPRGLKHSIPLADCLMAGFAVFGMKFPSLLQFDNGLDDPVVKHNLRTLYGVKESPSDTYMRERLDVVDPKLLRPAFVKIFSLLQRGKIIEEYNFLENCVLVACDGTGMFSSDAVRCSNCCEKHHKDGRITYYHQMLAGVLIHPDHREVFPFCPEPISKEDGSTKNDCEQNACRRFLAQFFKEHPHLNVIFTYDALSAKVPYLRPILEGGAHFIVGVNPTGNPSLFAWLKGVEMVAHKVVLGRETMELSFFNKIPLNDANHDFEVNFVDCRITDKKGKVSHFSWVTDILVTKENVVQIARGGRARWKIENETFNTLKNQGYNFEHNYGHGYQHLSHVLGFLMFLAFLVDQVQQHCCGLFQAAVKHSKSKVRFWRRQQSIFIDLYIASWEDLFLWMVDRGHGGVSITETS